MNLKKMTCMICALAILVSGCATTGGPNGAGNDSSDKNTALRCAAFGTIGALIGAGLGGTKGAVKGAIAGLAACAIIEISSLQTKKADEVEAQYKVANKNQLPTASKIDTYSSFVTPSGVAKAGDAIKVQSTIRVIAGTNEPIQEVKEVLIAYAPTGEEFKRGEKKVNETAGSGEYDNSFTLKLPQGAPQGYYKLTTQVFLNGKPGEMRQSSLQVAGTGIDTGFDTRYVSVR